jgi:hypothetical protein
MPQTYLEKLESQPDSEKFDFLRGLCRRYLAGLRSGEIGEDNQGKYENEILETTLELTLGSGVWDEMNEAME